MRSLALLPLECWTHWAIQQQGLHISPKTGNTCLTRAPAQRERERERERERAREGGRAGGRGRQREREKEGEGEEERESAPRLLSGEGEKESAPRPLPRSLALVPLELRVHWAIRRQGGLLEGAVRLWRRGALNRSRLPPHQPSDRDHIVFFRCSFGARGNPATCGTNQDNWKSRFALPLRWPSSTRNRLALRLLSHTKCF